MNSAAHLRLAAVVFGATAAALLGGCETTPGRPRMPSTISLEHVNGGRAVGPVYVVTLYDDGRVLFEGHASVKSKGTFTKHIPPEEARRIFGEAETANIWERESRYDIERGGENENQIVRIAPTDAASDNLILSTPGRTKRIDALFYPPRVLQDLKTHIEQAVGLAEWVGPPSEWKD